MYKKNGIVYSSAYKYLKHKDTGTISFYSHGDIDDYEEFDIDINSEIIKVSDFVFIIDGKIAICAKSTDYGDLKSSVVKMRYSNDDQIAIMLNREESEEKELEYQRMQEWREFSSDVAKAIQSAMIP